MKHPLEIMTVIMDFGDDRYQQGKRDGAAEQRAKDAAIARGETPPDRGVMNGLDINEGRLCERIARKIEEQA